MRYPSQTIVSLYYETTSEHRNDAQYAIILTPLTRLGDPRSKQLYSSNYIKWLLERKNLNTNYLAIVCKSQSSKYARHRESVSFFPCTIKKIGSQLPGDKECITLRLISNSGSYFNIASGLPLLSSLPQSLQLMKQRRRLM